MSELAYTLLPIGVFLRGLKVDGCLLSLQSTILLCIYVTKLPRAPGDPVGSDAYLQLSRKLSAILPIHVARQLFRSPAESQTPLCLFSTLSSSRCAESGLVERIQPASLQSRTH